MTSVAVLLLVSGVLGLLGIALHEATHWLLWRVQGRHAVFTRQGIQPVVVVPDASLADVELRDRIATIGPLAIGTLSGCLALAAGIPITFPVFIAWLGYTGVSVLDLRVALATPEHA